MIKAELLKPLDGYPEGSVREFDKVDFDTLSAMGAVRVAVDGALRHDGPTIAQFVAAGYKAALYPPEGYVSKSTDAEIASAVAADEVAAAKAAPVVANKMAPPVVNKSAPVKLDGK